MARPSEIKAVSAVLMEPADDVREVAKAAISALDESRKDRTDYLVVRQLGTLADAFGPYATYSQAAKAIEGQKIPAVDGTRFFVIPMRHQSTAEATFANVDADPMSEGAKRMWAIARAGGMRASSSSRKNRRRVA